MKEPIVSDFSVLIGIDWADKKHDVCEVVTGTQKMQFSVISSKPDALNDWAQSLKKRYPNTQIAIACELKKGPLIYALSRHSHITLFPVDPSTVAKYRKAFTSSGSKNDPTDACIINEILSLHMDKLTSIKPESADIRTLTQLVEYRRKLVQDRVDLSNRMTATLKNYYPQVLDWFKEKDTVIFCDFVSRWPSLPLIKSARKSSLQAFFNQHNSRYSAVNDKRIIEIKAAVPLTEDCGVIDPNRILMELLAPQLKLLIESIMRMDKEIKRYYKKQDDRIIFDSFPGAGPQLAPRLLAAFGNNRDKYKSAAELQKYAGVAPVIEQSGQKSWTHWRYSCTKFLRQTFVEWAGQSVRYSFWAKAYYDMQISKGKPHNTVIRALAFKWIRIAFRCWKNSTPYDESTYLKALKQRGSPLLEYAING